MPENCPFCFPQQDRKWFENEVGFVLWDAYPISKGHALVIPWQHAPSLFDLPPENQTAMWQFVSEVRSRLEKELHPDGFNIGLNDGESAGQTIMHAHIHVIPRWNGDVADPRGGVRWIIPEKARYWSDP